MSDLATEAVEAVKRLHVARMSHKDSRHRLQCKRAKVGDCEGRFSYDGEPLGPCYMQIMKDLCSSCEKTQDLWEEYQRRAHAAGAALRRAVFIGRKCFQAQEDES